MKGLIAITACFVSVLWMAPSAVAHEEPAETAATKTPPPGLKLENLMKEVLEGAEGIEIIVSRVTMPPHTALPKHWHPGEEFAYMIDGTLTLWQDGKEDILMHAGDVGMVPLKQVHTAITGEVGATVIVFRVHEQGQPERVLVD